MPRFNKNAPETGNSEGETPIDVVHVDFKVNGAVPEDIHGVAIPVGEETLKGKVSATQLTSALGDFKVGTMNDIERKYESFPEPPPERTIPPNRSFPSNEDTSNGQPRSRDDNKPYDSFSERETGTGGTIPPQRLIENSEPKVGDMLSGRYEVLAELGRGGMGVVYCCFDTVAGVEVAVKALPSLLSNNRAEMKAVKENFQLVAGLVHQNIAVSKTIEREPANGAYYLVMELVDGEELRSWMRSRRTQEGRVPLDAALPILLQVAEALDYAHAQRIIHRDVKPANVMVRKDGLVKVMDFGIAAQIHTSLTRISQAVTSKSGTHAYMSPEQWRGKPQNPATDQYSLAVMAYEMLSGHLPFDAMDPVVLKHAVCEEIPEPIEGVPETANHALRRALAKNPADRFPSCRAFVKALNNDMATMHTCGDDGLVVEKQPEVAKSQGNDDDLNEAHPSLVKHSTAPADAAIACGADSAQTNSTSIPVSDVQTVGEIVETEAQTPQTESSVDNEIPPGEAANDKPSIPKPATLWTIMTIVLVIAIAIGVQWIIIQVDENKANDTAIVPETTEDLSTMPDLDYRTMTWNDLRTLPQYRKATESRKAQMQNDWLDSFMGDFTHEEIQENAQYIMERLLRQTTVSQLQVNLALLRAGYRVPDAAFIKADPYMIVDLKTWKVRHCTDGPDLSNNACRTTELWLRKILPGSFYMGSPMNEIGRGYDETQHSVTLTQGYYIGVFECTQKQWELVMGSNPSFFKGEDLTPVDCLSYDMIRGSSPTAGAGWPRYGHRVDADSFMGRLQKNTGFVFDLPTEAQWEYACRAGTVTALNSGKDLSDAKECDNLGELGNYSGNTDIYKVDLQVGRLKPNKWGLFDMHGNVFEWCLDWYGSYFSTAETDPTGPGSGDIRVRRGGCWMVDASFCRSANRQFDDAGLALKYNIGCGFRVCCFLAVDMASERNE